MTSTHVAYSKLSLHLMDRARFETNLKGIQEFQSQVLPGFPRGLQRLTVAHENSCSFAAQWCTGLHVTGTEIKEGLQDSDAPCSFLFSSSSRQAHPVLPTQRKLFFAHPAHASHVRAKWLSKDPFGLNPQSGCSWHSQDWQSCTISLCMPFGNATSSSRKTGIGEN